MSPPITTRCSPSPFQIGAGILLLAAAAPLASAQNTPVMVGGLNWKPIEAGVGDLNPIGTSQRVLPFDMRAGTGSEQVFQIDGRPRFFGAGAEPGYYMRRNAGLSMVFPRSSYSPSQVRPGKLKADVPPGTIYSIGGDLRQLISYPQPAKPSNEPRKPASNFVDRSAGKNPSAPDQPKADPARPDAPARPAPVPTNTPAPAQPADRAKPAPVERDVRAKAEATVPAKSIWTDDEYRKQRMGALLDQAAKASLPPR